MRGIIERWGRGTNRIIEQTLEAGLAEPEMIDSRLAFMVRFDANPPVSLPPGLSTIQEDILRSLRQNGPVSFGQLVKEFSGSYSEDQVQRALQHLRTRHFAVRSGATRSSVWSAPLIDQPD